MSECPLCVQTGSSKDSPLSTAGNILGIMTFAYAILATVWIYVSRLQSADAEQRKLIDTAYANYVRWKLMVNEYEDVIRAGGEVSGDFKNLLQHRFDTGGEAMQRLDLALQYDPNSGRAARTRQKGRFVIGQRQLHELLLAANNATNDVATLLDGITQEQMHRELKLQHALLQQIASKVGVSAEATAEIRAAVEDAPEGVPIASLLSTPPILELEQDYPLTKPTAEVDEKSQSGSNDGSSPVKEEV